MHLMNSFVIDNLRIIITKLVKIFRFCSCFALINQPLFTLVIEPIDMSTSLFDCTVQQIFSLKKTQEQTDVL